MSTLAAEKLQTLIRIWQDMVHAEGQLFLEARLIWNDFCSPFIPTMKEFLGRRLYLLPHEVHRKICRLVFCALQRIELVFKHDLHTAVALIDEAKAIYMDTSGQLNLMEARRLPRRPSLSPPRRCTLVSNSRYHKRRRGRDSYCDCKQ